MKKTIPADLIDAKTGFFQKWNETDRFDLYQAGLSWPIIATMIDGFGVPASWTQRFGMTRTDTLFAWIEELSKEWNGFYIKDQDDAWSELDWERKLSGLQISSAILEEFIRNPAMENGSAYLGLYLESADDLILFTYTPAEFFRISVHGKMIDILKKKMKGEPDGSHNSGQRSAPTSA
ncbi:hypothetical protein [Pelagicoccus albus]|uniref:Uncharacterized protein n=1 Tax=Pelagicoccus albus TaxID=415222 RepID=A0A7X1B8H3_9BACT|nr:hypothetical protein [Pelagicoccus albus]MBC2606315.1 hypothetical protein [Pelagicoccus albus]